MRDKKRLSAKSRMSKDLWERLQNELERKKGQIEKLTYLNLPNSTKIIAYRIHLKEKA